MISSRFRIGVLCCIGVASGSVFSVAGCGQSTGPSRTGISATTAAAEGLAALEKKEWKAADESFSKAIDAKILPPDQYEEALLGRARARTELGEYAAAADDLTQLEFQAAAMDQVWLLKCALALRQNHQEAAREAYEKALKINPKLPKPEGLN